MVFAETDTLVQNIQEVSAMLLQNKPIMLRGPSSAGKTHLITTLAARLDKKLITLHLTYLTDAKSLLGGYVMANDDK